MCCVFLRERCGGRKGWRLEEGKSQIEGDSEGERVGCRLQTIFFSLRFENSILIVSVNEAD